MTDMGFTGVILPQVNLHPQASRHTEYVQEPLFVNQHVLKEIEVRLCKTLLKTNGYDFMRLDTTVIGTFSKLINHD
jgi:hypothetical protein